MPRLGFRMTGRTPRPSVRTLLALTALLTAVVAVSGAVLDGPQLSHSVAQSGRSPAPAHLAVDRISGSVAGQPPPSSPDRVSVAAGSVQRPHAGASVAAGSAERALARVGGVEITEGDLRRYQDVARVSGRITVQGQDLEELVTRTLLVLAGGSRGIELSPAELAQAVRRRRALAALQPASAIAPPVADEDLAEEARLDALAEKV